MMLFTAINQNMKEPISCSLVLESLKADIQGLIIFSSAHVNKSHEAKLQEPSINIIKLNKQITISPSPSSLKHKVIYRLNLILFPLGMQSDFFHDHPHI